MTISCRHISKTTTRIFPPLFFTSFEVLRQFVYERATKCTTSDFVSLSSHLSRSCNSLPIASPMHLFTPLRMCTRTRGHRTVSSLHHRYLTVRTISLSPLHKRLAPPINVLPTLPLIVHCVTKMRKWIASRFLSDLTIFPDREQWGVKCKMEDAGNLIMT
jgi:hypothetical protein